MKLRNDRRLPTPKLVEGDDLVQLILQVRNHRGGGPNVLPISHLTLQNGPLGVGGFCKAEPPETQPVEVVLGDD